ncbi:ribosomal protein S12 methylthiotransferase accessory factor [Kitasatospora sp. MMS16-BH015]|uniref:TOMM precursor leader peptide-binding protein n=1 Tax=Kitasatospora sp. MMS16-BH015 TaxID=2018025 RepID=UPI000CA27934|nr:TOMM precursor leader peptide-binding protein [Kitasatospora sp. MMS16-BH015]AUG78886.1 ribosomal protein S12 methylthiotransferase accessory factor [Kitasatospora sp. MMS16-BH015]
MTTQAGNESAPLIGFKQHLRAEVVPGDAVYLMSERGVTAVAGAELAALAPLLDGTRDLPTLLSEATPTVRPEQVAKLIGQLTHQGLLDHRPPQRPAEAGDSAARAYWELAGGAPERAGTLRITAVGEVDDAPLRAACLAAGIPPAGAGRPADLDLVVCSDYLDPRLRAVDAERRADGRPWLLTKVCGTTLWVGPVFRPGAGACWNCLAHRLRGHRHAEAPVRLRHGGAPVPIPKAALPVTVGLGAQLAALECTKWLAGRRSGEQDCVTTLDTLTLATRSHRLTRRPQCPDCGDASMMAGQAERPVVLTHRRSRATGGGHRALSSQHVLNRYGHLLSPVTGVVKDIRRDPRGPELLNVYRAGHNPALGPRRMSELRATLRQESCGKGRTPLEAQVGALCEAVERISGSWQGDEARVRGSLRSLGPDAVHPGSCQLWDERQFAQRAGANAGGHPFHRVAEPFDPDAVLDWSPVWSLTRARHVLFPTTLLYYNVPDQPGRRMVHADSNGCAAGGTLEDAALQGLLELVERDAVALWWYNRTRQPAVDLTSFGDPWTAEVCQAHAELGRAVWALDLTSDLGVPVVAALSRRTGRGPEDIVFGFGAHPDPAIALCRALTEMNQLLPPVLGAHPDGTGYGCADPVALHWWRTATRDGMPYLAPDPAAPARTPLDYGYRPTGDLLDELRSLQGTLEQRGLEVCILDQTRPDLGLPVVRTLVPGLRHFWPRFAPGRLFDVPVSLGRLPRPTPYEELNPIPLFV